MAIVMAMERMMLMSSIVLRGENRREMSERQLSCKGKWGLKVRVYRRTERRKLTMEKK